MLGMSSTPATQSLLGIPMCWLWTEVSLDTVKEDGTKVNEKLTHLSRAAHFGERSLLRGESAAPVNIDAGTDGVELTQATLGA